MKTLLTAPPTLYTETGSATNPKRSRLRPNHNQYGRWKERLTRADVSAIEATVGDCLEENGYELSLPDAERKRGLRQSWMRGMYPAFLDGKLWMKLHTPVGRLANMSVLELEEESAPVPESVRS